MSKWTKRSMFVALGIITLPAGYLYWLLEVPKTHEETAILEAAFTPDGSAVYFLQREIKAVVDPGGLFCMPGLGGCTEVRVRMTRDLITVRKILLSDRRVVILETLPEPPWSRAEYTDLQPYWHPYLGVEAGWSPAGEFVYAIDSSDNSFLGGVLGRNYFFDPDTRKWRTVARWADRRSILFAFGEKSSNYVAAAGVLHGVRGSLFLLNREAETLETISGPPMSYESATMFSSRGLEASSYFPA